MLITVLYCTIFFAAFNFTSSIMAGLYIVQELGGSADIASYNVTLFGLGNASTFPLAHFLGARFGVRSVLLTGLALFALCTWGCALAPTFFIFVLLRLLSGICTGVFFPLGMEWIQSLFPMEQRNKSFNYLAVLTTISPVLGASFGGWLSYDFHWSLVFYTQLPLIIFCFFILYQQQGPKPTETPPLDVPGFLSYLLTIFPLTLFVCLGQELDWLRSPLLSWLLPVGLGSLLFFCAWEWRQQEPFIQLRLFTIPLFSLSCLFLILLYSAYFGMVILLTLWLHLNANYTVLWISLLLSHMLIAAWLLYLFLAKWMGKFSPWY
ncbi:MAG: MFS transporter, partial [Chlamydiae bacterium]|nr:MFS transporter [Chlamydiota bacterium]